MCFCSFVDHTQIVLVDCSHSQLCSFFAFVIVLLDLVFTTKINWISFCNFVSLFILKSCIEMVAMLHEKCAM